MADNGKSFDSLRFNRLDLERLAVIFAVSFAAHVVVFGGYEIAKSLRLIPSLRLFAKKTPSPIQNHEQPLIFAMVEHPSAEAPKKAKYYGAQNSVAADQSHKNLSEAELKGKQAEIPVVETAPKPDFNKLQPQPKSSSEPSKPKTEPGDLTLANPQKPETQPEQRPRKLSEVKPHRVPGLKMLQNGGAPRAALVPSLNVKASPFGAYDEQFIEAVTQRWYDLLDNQQFALDRTGKVVVKFHLNYDGTISDMNVLQNNVGVLLATLCEDAIHDPAPYAAWPEEMHRTIGKNYREITFTFFYY